MRAGFGARASRPMPQSFCATTNYYGSEHGAKGRLECGDWSPLWLSFCWHYQAACCLEFHEPECGRTPRRPDDLGRQAASCGSRSTRESGDQSPHSKRACYTDCVRPKQKLCGIGRPARAPPGFSYSHPYPRPTEKRTWLRLALDMAVPSEKRNSGRMESRRVRGARRPIPNVRPAPVSLDEIS